MKLEDTEDRLKFDFMNKTKHEIIESGHLFREELLQMIRKGEQKKVTQLIDVVSKLLSGRIIRFSILLKEFHRINSVHLKTSYYHIIRYTAIQRKKVV